MSGKKRLEWSIRSSVNVESIRDYIESENPAAAQNVLTEIRATAYSLRDFPMLGHPGQRAGTRELVLSRYPYTIVYRLSADRVRVIAVTHQSKKHPT